jgi:FkbM family methyltransferase
VSLLGHIALGGLRAYSRVAPTERGGFRLARMARAMLPREKWKGTFTAPGGARLNLDLGTYPDCCMAVGLYELDTARVLARILKPGDHFVDCGANIGYFTLMAARLVGPTGRVDAFEPDPVNRARLEEHLRMNGSPSSVTVQAVALSDQDGWATLYHPSDAARNHGEASLFAPAGVKADSYTVPLARLDRLVSAAPRLVKMDIEGAELAAIGGMTELLKGERPPELIVEHNPASASSAGHRPGDLLRALQKHRERYRAYWVGWGLKEMRAEEVDGMGRQGNILYRAL